MAALLAARAAPLAGARPAAVQRARASVRVASACTLRGVPARAQLHGADAPGPSRREAVLGAALLVRTALATWRLVVMR
jgi:hypothetical protein